KNYKKTILYFVTQSELGGVQRYIFDLAENFKNEFDVAVAFGEQGEKGELAVKLKNANIKFYSLPHLKRAISPWNDFLALIEIIKLIKKLKPNIIHLNSSKISILGSIAFAFIRIFAISRLAFIRQISIIYTVHGWVFNEPMPKWKKLFYKYAEKFTAIFKNKIICISKLDYDIAKNRLKIPEKKLSLIYHGIKPITFLPREEARQNLIPQSPFVIKKINEENAILVGIIANLYKTKGLEYLIQATKLIIDAGAKIKIIIIGEGEERKNLEDLITQINLKNTVLLSGRIDNAAELLRGFDIFCCSSVKEGFPYAILEAMQAGLPIVSTNVGGISDMISDRKNGLLAEAKNSQNLAKKIIELINNPELAQKLGAQAKNDVGERFGFDGMIGKTMEMYLR
ncbi:glycosyltransferase, partial [Candidatus Parcubacteria bacterium]|nr:glycosyltransferase [Candidatus Parcubacteria bacterium]